VGVPSPARFAAGSFRVLLTPLTYIPVGKAAPTAGIYALIALLPESPLSLRERVRERGSNKEKVIILYPLILSFSRREKGRSVCTVVTGIHVQHLMTVCINIFIHDFTDISISIYGTAMQRLG
jgi:hypothetical protein